MIRRLASLVLLVLLFTVAKPCGPFVPSFHLVVVGIPDGPRSEWAAGRLGLLQPHLHTQDLVIAWRWLAGVGLDAAEQKALIGPYEPGVATPSGLEQWKKAREVAGAAPKPLETGRTEDYREIPVVGDHALALAAQTLLARLKQFGKGSEAVTQWLEAQDRVFAWKGPEAAPLPEPAPKTLPLLLQQDRAYQRAAAAFYREDLLAALQGFRAIAADRANPWRGWSQYMLARIYSKHGSVAGDPIDGEAALAAVVALQKDPAFPDIHVDAAALENRLRFQEDPEGFYDELLQHLAQKGRGEALVQDIDDLRWLRILEPWTEGLKDTVPTGVHAWIDLLQKGGLEDALKAYEAEGSVPNLVAVMLLMTPEHPQVEAFLKKAQAASLHPGPAYATLVSHRLRILVAQKRWKAAEALADEALAQPGAATWPSAFNLWSSVKLACAKDVDAFAAHLGRRIAAMDEGEGLGIDETLEKDGSLRALDPWSVPLLNRQFPLRLWEALVTSPKLAEAPHGDLVEALWARAAVLGREDLMRKHLPALKRARPKLAADLDAWAAEPDAAKRRGAAFFILWEHRLWPQVMTVREEALQFGTLYARWEGPPAPAAKPMAPAFVRSDESPRTLVGYGLTLAPPFLDEAARKEGEAEAARIPAPLTWFCSEALALAEARPEDPQVPEALSRAVRASRNANRDDKSAALVLKAFRLLHKKYPNSPGAKEAKVYH